MNPVFIPVHRRPNVSSFRRFSDGSSRGSRISMLPSCGEASHEGLVADDLVKVGRSFEELERVLSEETQED